MSTELEMTTIAPVKKKHAVLGLGCWAFGGEAWGGQDDERSLAAMAASLECGINHFDTAEGYGGGRSERLVGQFLAADAGRRKRIYLATKQFPGDVDAIESKLDTSLANLGVDSVDLYYIHWPRTGVDMRPFMEGMERMREKGRIRSVGVSNFSVAEMEQVSQVGTIDAHQLCYNLFWRYPERDVIPYCRENDIAVVTYSSIAQGILTGKFDRDVSFPEGDLRAKMVLFEEDVWPHVCDGVDELRKLAAEADRPMTDLAIQWVAAQPGVTSVLVGARDAEQARRNADAMTGRVDESILARMTPVGDEVMKHVPDAGNLWRLSV